MIKEFAQLSRAICFGVFVWCAAPNALGQAAFDPASSLQWRYVITTEGMSIYTYSPARAAAANARFVSVWQLVLRQNDAVYGIQEIEFDCSTSRSRTARSFGSATYMGNREYVPTNNRSDWATPPAGSLSRTWLELACSNQSIGNALERPFTAREIATINFSGEIVGRPTPFDCDTSADQAGLSPDLLRQMSEQVVGDMLASDVLRTAAPNGERPRLVVSVVTEPDSVSYFVRNALVESGSVRVFGATAQNVADPGVLQLWYSCSRETGSSVIVELTLRRTSGGVLGGWSRRFDR